MKKLISKLTMHSVMISTGLIPCIVCFLVLAQVSNVDVTSAMEEGA